MKKVLVEEKRYSAESSHEYRIKYEYNEEGMLIKKTAEDEDGVFTIEYEYSTDENSSTRREITNDSISEVTFDHKGRLVEEKRMAGDVIARCDRYEYSDNAEERIFKYFPNGTDECFVIKQYKDAAQKPEEIRCEKFDQSGLVFVTKKYKADDEDFYGVNIPEKIKKELYSKIHMAVDNDVYEVGEFDYRYYAKYFPEKRILRKIMDKYDDKLTLCKEVCYDEHFNIISEADYHDGITKYKYNEKGQEIWQEFENSFTGETEEIVTEYDNLGRIAKISKLIVFESDRADREEYTYEYDEDNSLIRKITKSATLSKADLAANNSKVTDEYCFYEEYKYAYLYVEDKDWKNDLDPNWAFVTECAELVNE